MVVRIVNSLTSRKIVQPMLLLVILTGISGCHDGPLYALKHANPFFTMNEWKADRELGTTEHERREELLKLNDSIASMPTDQQQSWTIKLQQIMENDPSSDMRFQAVQIAGNLSDGSGQPIIESGLKDDSDKVRMAACQMLGKRSDESSARLLATVAGAESSNDVRQAAIMALGNHQSQIAIDSLRIALKNRDPATQSLAIQSLRGSTGKDYGTDPAKWIAALDGEPVPEQEATQIADRLRQLF